MADTQPITSEAKAPYKRKMTDKRRDQNRAAQKLYRERRKERLETLERQVETLKDQGQLFDDNSCFGQAFHPFSLEDDMLLPDLGVNNDTALAPRNDPAVAGLKHVLEMDYWKDKDELLEFARREKPNIGIIILAGLRALKLESEAELVPHDHGQNSVARPLVRAERYPQDSVLRLGTHFKDVHGWLDTPNMPTIPDPLRDGILFRRQPILDVLYQNCVKIGLRLEDLMQYTCPSPWYSPFPSLPSSLVPIESVPPDLYPTPAQRRIPHHPFIDLIPFPWLRERAVTLGALDPPPFDRFELKQDVISNGMICWKSSTAGNEGLPWDRRNWEIQPWFQSKWGWLIEEQGRVEQQSRWWRMQRHT